MFYNHSKDDKRKGSKIKDKQIPTIPNFEWEDYWDNKSIADTAASESIVGNQFSTIVELEDSSYSFGINQCKEPSPEIEVCEERSSISHCIGDSSNLTISLNLNRFIPLDEGDDQETLIGFYMKQKEFQLLTEPSLEIQDKYHSAVANGISKSTSFKKTCLYDQNFMNLMLRGNLNAERNFQPLTWFTSGTARLLYAFMHGFLASISPQLCHEELTPRAIFIPQGQGNPLMIEVFLACGLAFMSNVHLSYEVASRKAYSNCLSRFADKLAQFKEPQEWMIAAMLLFCLRDKVIGELPIQAATHLSKAISHIDIVFESRCFDVKNIKFMIESFLFNYSVLLLAGGKKVRNILPSPFLIYEKWRRLLNMQMYSCVVPWMNNPVFGAAAQAFENAAKVSWLVCEHPLTSDNMTIACDLLLELSELDDTSGVIVPENIVGAGRQHLQDSKMLSNVIVVACKIALYKLINPSFDEANYKIQKLAQKGLRLMQHIPLNSPVNVIVGWPALIIGLCLIDADQRFSLSNRCIFVSEVNCVAYLKQVERFLDRIWTSSEVREHKNLDHLFDELGDMCL